METSSLYTFFTVIGSVALVLLVILLGIVLFYTVSILRVIREITILARTKAQGLSIKVTDLKKYVGGATVLKLLTLFFRTRKAKKLKQLTEKGK
jgi:hypothetical protein